MESGIEKNGKNWLLTAEEIDYVIETSERIIGYRNSGLNDLMSFKDTSSSDIFLDKILNATIKQVKDQKKYFSQLIDALEADPSDYN
ncbi:MAG: hypothetical protein PHH54_06650 [Candidatus Nanoarchaeia archaeon]|nr:hypothetical protein [Candidatus Nanoarchaeia archaeon]MDD5741635.1 hypothetical protein [Candidatus Nanoarchaeia archaeon]